MNTYNLNLETGKLELHFEKSTYMALPEENKKAIKSSFLWSNFAGAWVSRAKNPNLYWPKKVAEDLKLIYEGEVGEKKSFAEQIESQQERSEARVERMEARANKAEKESTSHYQAAKAIGDFIPFGQPILVGHHSEGRHRRDISRIDNNMRKSCEASDKAEYYEQKAQGAKWNAPNEKFKSVKYLLNRIAECEKELRAVERSLAGKDMYNKVTGEKMINGCDISEDRTNRLNERKNEWIEKLDFFKGKLQEIGGGAITADRLKELRPKYVKIDNQWWPLKSINRDTVTVLNWLGIAGFTWKFKFDRIKAMEAGYITIVHDRDGNEVKPTIAYKDKKEAFIGALK